VLAHRRTGLILVAVWVTVVVLAVVAVLMALVVVLVLVAVVPLPPLFDPTRGLSARLVTGLVICNAKWLDTSFWKKSMGVRVPVT
tara:strand:+ start:344 stop:598 length:255 start_codon:yes stop_codon:yes gene_type:complete